MKCKWQHIEFVEGNPYICKTEEELKRLQKKYELVQIKDGFWKEVV